MNADPRPVEARRAEVERFDFRRVHPALRLGTASDRYAAWIGPIYPRDVWADRVETRTKRLGAGSIEERLLPVESVEDYFAHFGVLELDFTFYRPLVEPSGKPGPPLFTLQRYAEAAPAGARFLLKAPQAFTARTLRRRVDGRTAYVENPTYLDAEAFTAQFAVPAAKALGPRLAGVIVEQEYARVRESPPPEAFLVELDAFFRAVPPEVRYHLEVRSPHLLVPPYFDWLASRGLGFVFSHWTWLPPLRDQWRLAGERLLAATGGSGTPEAVAPEAVVRLMNPREMSYDDALRLAYPFDAPVPALAETPQARQMVDDATALAYRAVADGVTLNVIANNRAWGSSPHLAQALAQRFLDFAERRGA